MTLQFDSSAYGQAFQQGEENRLENERMPLEALALLGQGVQKYQAGQQAKAASEQAKQLYELQLKEAQAKGKDRDLENTPLGQLLSSNQMSSPVAPPSLFDKVEIKQGMGALPMEQQPGGSMIEKFRQFQRGGRFSPPQVDMSSQALAQPDLSVFGLPPEAAGMTLGQIKRMGEAKKLFAEAGQGDYIPPDVFKAALSGDASTISESYPKGVPSKVASLAATSQRAQGTQDIRKTQMANLQDERSERESERVKTRYRNYLLDIEQRDPVIKEMNKQGLALGQVDQILQLARSGNTVSAGTLGFKMGRAMGEVGVMTDQDVVRYVQSGALGRSAADKLSRWIRGVPTDATLEEIQEISKVLQDTFQSKIQPKYDNYINSYAKIEQMEPQDFAAKLSLPYGGSSRTDSSGGGLDPDKKARLEELRRKKASGTLGK